MSHRHGHLLTGILFGLGLACICNSAYSEGVVSETDSGKRTMSKFMINLAKFVTWPDASFSGEEAPYRYCILGRDAIGTALEEAMDGKNAKNRPFDLQRLAMVDLEAAKSCHVVFIGAASADEVAPVISSLIGLPILTVGEIENFAQYGGMVGFYGKGRKVALAINQKRLEGAGLNASSKLYRASTM
jgi:hypothetical protein